MENGRKMEIAKLYSKGVECQNITGRDRINLKAFLGRKRI
jgi:hypothetical protein